MELSKIQIPQSKIERNNLNMKSLNNRQNKIRLLKRKKQRPLKLDKFSFKMRSKKPKKAVKNK